MPTDNNRDRIKDERGHHQATYLAAGRATVIIISLTFFSKVLALSKEIFTADVFGTSPELDVFNIAFAIPGLLSLVIASAVQAVLVPLYFEWRQKNSPKGVNERLSSVIIFCICLIVILTTACVFTANYYFPLVGFGLDETMSALGEHIEQQLALIILLEGSAALFAGVLQAWKMFSAISLAQSFANIFLILFLLLFREWGVWLMVYGSLAGSLGKLIFLVAATAKTGRLTIRVLPFQWRECRVFLSLSLPLLGADLIANANLLVDQSIASSLEAGSVSALRYAFRLNDLPSQLLFTAIAQAIFPYISEQVADLDYAGLRYIFYRSILFIAIFAIPTTIYVEFHALDIVTALLKRGAFDDESVKNTALCLQLYALGLSFIAYSFINGAFFTAMKYVKSLLYIGLLSLVLNALLDLLFIKLFGGVHGVALSSSVISLVVGLLFFSLLRRRLRLSMTASEIRSLLIPVLASAVAFAACAVILPWMSSLPVWPRLILSSVLFFAVYTGVMFGFRTKEIGDAMGGGLLKIWRGRRNSSA